MKFLNGYIVATILTGIVSLLDYLNKWNINIIWIMLPVLVYLVIVILVSTIKMKG